MALLLAHIQAETALHSHLEYYPKRLSRASNVNQVTYQSGKF